MKPTIQAVRAIAAEFLRRKVRPLIIIGACAAVLLIALGAWLMHYSIYWWFFLAPVIMLSILFIILAGVTRFVISLVDSTQSRDQKRAVRAYVDQLERVTENVQMPYPVIVARTAYDVVRPSPDGFIASVSRDAQTVAPDFVRLVKSFV